MRIAILSDAVLPTPTAGGHGLGVVVSMVAEGLYERGHDVTLFARHDSAFSGPLVMPAEAEGYEGEAYLAREAMRIHRQFPFDAFLDNGHLHTLARIFPELPIVNVFHDMYQQPARCAVLPSEGMRSLLPPEFEGAKVIRNALDPADFLSNEVPADPPYALWLGAFQDFKQPVLAIEACARYGVKLVMAGGSLTGRLPFGPSESVDYKGIVFGEQKHALIRNARVFLQLGYAESFGLTTLEAGLLGTPVVAWPGGGSYDLIRYGINGAFVSAVGADKAANVCDAIDRAWYINRRDCRELAEQFAKPQEQLDKYEDALAAVMMGAWW